MYVNHKQTTESEQLNNNRYWHPTRTITKT